MGTTLMRGACIMGGMGVRTCPGARRICTGAMGGRGITGTADRRVVRTGGSMEGGARAIVFIGGLGLGRRGAEEMRGD